MSLSKAQFAVLMLLAASAAGIGVGWLTRSVPGGEHLTAQPSAARPTLASNDGLKEEIAALRNELRELKRHPETTVKAAVEEIQPVQYQGKPKNYWLTALRDRDSEFREKALEPLTAIAEVDRSVVPVIIAALNDKAWNVQKKAISCLDNLDPPAPEAAPTLFRSDLELTTILSLLKKCDPKGQITIPLAKAALNDEQIGVRAGFILLAFDNTARLPITLLAQAVTKWQDTICYTRKGDEEEHEYRKQAVLAAQLLCDRGAEAREALPALIEGLKHFSGRKERFSNGISSYTRNDPTDWFVASLLSVDPEGQTAVPLLVKALDDPDENHRRNVTRMLGEYGAKAKTAVPRLLAVIKSEETKPQKNLTPNSEGRLAVPGSVEEAETKPAPLREVALEAVKKIEAKPSTSKEPPIAEPRKPAKKSKSNEKDSAQRGSNGA